MATLVFDIATTGQEWEALSRRSQIQLTRFTTEPEARERLGLSPFTGSIVSLGLYDVERRQGVVYQVGAEGEGYKACTEIELLEDFWEGAQSYDVFVTFGGRRFDVPWLLHRSAILGVTPTREFPMSSHVHKQSVPYHIDLFDEFTFHRSLTTPITLHILAEAYGMESPDNGEVTGETVGEFFRQKKFADLARYTEANVAATAALYERWLTHFAPRSFLNALL